MDILKFLLSQRPEIKEMDILFTQSGLLRKDEYLKD